MKRLFCITLLLIFSLPLFAKNKVFFYDYNNNDCYYALELNMTLKVGTFYACNCYDKLDYLEMEFHFDYFSSRKNKKKYNYSHKKTENIILHPYCYKYPTRYLTTHIKSGKVYFEPNLLEDKFFFLYDVKDQWNRLDY